MFVMVTMSETKIMSEFVNDPMTALPRTKARKRTTEHEVKPLWDPHTGRESGKKFTTAGT